jgi:phage-related minor tail protein
VSLTIGELVGIIDLDDDQWTRGLASADGDFDKFISNIDRELEQLERQFERESKAFADEMERGFQELDDIVEEAFADAEREAAGSGQEVGEAFTRGADGRLRDAKGRFVKAGEDAGEGFSGGLGTSGSEGASAAGMDMMGSLKGLGWAAAGVAIGAVLMDGFTKALDAEKAGDKLAAQIGAGAELSGELGRIAGELYANAYGESVTDVNEALRAVWQSGIVPEDESIDGIKAITATAMDFASAMDEDVSKAVRAAAKMIKTGLAEDGQAAFDILTRGMQQGADDADDLLDTFSEYPTMFRDLGLNGEQAMGLISQGLRAGARDSDTVADALKEFAIRAQDASTTSAKGFETIGLNAEEMTGIFARGGPEAAKALDTVLDRLRDVEDPVERNAAAVALFGTKAEDLGDALFALDPSEAVWALGQVDGAAAKMGDTLADNASTRIESFKRTMEQGLVSFIGDNVLPMLSELVDGLKLSGVPEAIGNIVSQGRELIGGIVDDVRDWASTHQEQIDRIVAGGKKLYDEVTKAVSETIEFIQDIWDSGGDDFIDTVATKIEATIQIISGMVEMIRGTVQVIAGILTGDWRKVWEGVQAIVQGAMDTVTGLIDNTIGALVEMLGGDWQAIKDGAFEWWTRIVGAIADKVTEIVTWVTGLPDRIGEALSTLGEKAKEWFAAGVEGIKWALTEGLEWVIAWALVLPYKLVEAGADLGAKLIEWIGNAWQWAKDTASRKGQELLDWARGLPGRVIDAVSDLNARIGDWARRAWQSAKDGAEEKGRELVQWAKDLPGRIVREIGDLGGKLFESGRALLRGFLDGIKSMAQHVQDQVSGVLDKVRGLFPFSPAKDGPFSGRGWVLYSGQSIGQAFAEGIASTTGDVVGATSDLLARASTGLAGLQLSPSVGVNGSLNAQTGPAGQSTGSLLGDGTGDMGGGLTIGTFNAYAHQTPAQISDELLWRRKATTGV